MLAEEKATILAHIRAIEINVSAMISMVETGKEHEKVLLQLQTSQAALHATGRLLLSYQLQRSIDNIRHNINPEEMSTELERLVDLYNFSWIYA